jgi:hypothetical protein
MNICEIINKFELKKSFELIGLGIIPDQVLYFIQTNIMLEKFLFEIPLYWDDQIHVWIHKVDSGCKCNFSPIVDGYYKNLIKWFKTVPLSRSVIQYIFRPFDSLMIHSVKISAFRKILSDKSIQIFVGIPSLAIIRPWKVKICTQLLSVNSWFTNSLPLSVFVVGMKDGEFSNG